MLRDRWIQSDSTWHYVKLYFETMQGVGASSLEVQGVTNTACHATCVLGQELHKC